MILLLLLLLLFCPSSSCTIICCINRFTSLCKNLCQLTWVFSRSFSMQCASLNAFRLYWIIFSNIDDFFIILLNAFHLYWSILRNTQKSLLEGGQGFLRAVVSCNKYTAMMKHTLPIYCPNRRNLYFKRKLYLYHIGLLASMFSESASCCLNAISLVDRLSLNSANMWKCVQQLTDRSWPFMGFWVTQLYNVGDLFCLELQHKSKGVVVVISRTK